MKRGAGYNQVMPGAKPSLNPDEILKAEFDYIAQSAFQANEDRSKAASFFLISVGSLVAAIFGAQELSTLEEVPLTLYRVLAGLFFVLTVLGGLTIFQLARLREAWIEAAFAMNQIKEYYAKRSSLDLMNAFRWRTETIPRQYKPDSISYYTALEVALLSGLTFGACVYFLQLGIPYTNCLWAFTLSSGA
ncbi:MAG: hypothetical protein AB1564_01130, partial [Chloroflexota bacterium]